MSVLVISNPRSRRARRRLEALRQALPETDALTHRVTDELAEATALMTATPWEAGDTLVVNGGDGTAQRMLTALLGSCPAERRPRIALLPGGSTNMTAFDLNRHRNYQRCLETLQHRLHAPSAASCSRPLVHVALTDSEQYGFFFGAGTIVQGIEYFNQRIRPGGGRHELGAGLALLRTAWGIARGQPPFAEPLRLSLPAASLEEAADCEEAKRWHPTATRLCLVTSLNRLFLGIRPYWNQGEAPLQAPSQAPSQAQRRPPLRATLVEADAVGFLRSLPRLLRGRPGAALTAARGYHSIALGALQLRFTGPFTLDGELFASGGDTIRIRASEPLRFLTL